MKKLLLPALFIISGCQNTLESNNEVDLLNSNIANSVDINQALVADESIDVFHPIADVEFTLKKEAVNNSDNIWPRIQQQLTFVVPENKRLIAQRNW